MTAPHTTSRRWWVRVPLVALAFSPCWVCPLSCAVRPVYEHWANKVPFTPDAWRTAGPTDRYDLSWDLLYGGVLSGKSEAEVLESLGPATDMETLRADRLPVYDAGSNRAGVVVWYYDLGHEKYEWQIGPSGAVLAVDFVGGRVIRTRKIVH